MKMEYRIRPAAVAAVLAPHRTAIFRDLGALAEPELPVVETASRACLISLIESGRYLGWLVEAGGEVIASGGVLLRRLLPRPGSLQGGEEAYILAWGGERRIPHITLPASDKGRPLYESSGFVQTSEM